MSEKMTYAGFHQDKHGITALGRVVLDGWLFGFIPREEDCAGWELARIQQLMTQNEAAWDQYGNLPSRLPAELQARHTEIYAWATARGRERGWDPELDEDE